tara:strand:+ start:50493 stop:51590 length:1098 start_codon:yes stop_codon:yes gene_type:complete
VTDYALSKGIIPSLDGLRAVSIAIVFAGHARLSTAIPGGLGVTVFFFLSGFLITTLLIREYDRYGSVSLPAFFARRVIRLMPPLLTTLFAGAVLVWLGLSVGALDVKTLLSQILFYFNYYAVYGAGEGESYVRGFAILWSLSVEEHFYFVWPFVFLVVARQGFSIRFIVVLLVAILAWRSYRYLVWLDSAWMIYTLTDTRFDSILYGCLLAVLQRRAVTNRLFPTTRWSQILILGSAFAVIFFTLIWREPVFRSTLRYSLQGLALMPLFHYAVTQPRMKLFQPLNWGWVRWIGVMSYTFYICHYVIIGMFTYLGLFEANYPAFVFASASAALLWSAAVYYLLEVPLKPLRKRLIGHPTLAPVGQP